MRRWVAVVVVAWALGSAPALASPHALVVGISEYADPSIADLEYAASDARQIAAVLEASCGFARQDILVLTDEEATRQGFLDGFGWIEGRVGPGDVVFLYLAGHGTNTLDRDGDEADGDGVDEVFLPQDAVLLDPETFLIDDELGALIGRIEAGAVTLWLDACYSGGQSRWVGARVPDIEARDSVARDVLTAGLGGPARSVFAACQPQELAYENPTLRHGVFTHFLLSALEDDDADDGDGVLTVSEIASYVTRSVATWSATREEKQTPVLDMVPGQDIALVPDLAAARRDGPRLVAYFPFDEDLEEKAGGLATVNRGGELVPGILGAAGRFDNAPGHTTYVRTASSYEPLEGPFAVSLWFRSDRIVRDQGFLFSTHARYNDYGPEYGVAMNADGSLTFRSDDARGQNHRQDLNTTTYRWDDGAWHHLVVTRHVDGRKEVWVDGRLEATELYSIQNLRTAGQPLTVGGSAYAAWASNRSFVGDIDDFRIYADALDPDTIRALLAMGVPEAPWPLRDPTLEKAVRVALEEPEGTRLTTHDALRVRSLSLDAGHEVDLFGIEACRGLRSLRLRGAGVADLQFVHALPALVELALPENRIDRVDALEGRVGIEILDLSHNRVSDLRPLAGLTSLAYANLSWNRISDLTPLAGLTKMKELGLRGNTIADSSPVGTLGQLRRLDLGQNAVRNVHPLVTLPKLVSLALDGNGLEDISALAQMPGLEELDLSWNALRDVSPLANLEWLGDYTLDTLGPWHNATLDLAGNLLDDPAPLLAFVGLGAGDSVDLSWNPLDAVSPQAVDAVFDALRARGVSVVMP